MRGAPHPEVRTLGDELAARVVAALEARAVALPPHGLAHGRPGVVLAALAWQAVSRSLPRDALRRAVIDAHAHGVAAGSDPRMASWAHGHAGMAMLFARA